MQVSKPKPAANPANEIVVVSWQTILKWLLLPLTRQAVYKYWFDLYEEW